MKNNLLEQMIRSRKVLIGNGKEYSSVANETVEVYHQWLVFSGADEACLDELMKAEAYEILEERNEFGETEVSIVAGGERVLQPFVFQGNNGTYEDFLVNCLLVLNVIAARYGKAFENAVLRYANGAIEKYKISLK